MVSFYRPFYRLAASIQLTGGRSSDRQRRFMISLDDARDDAPAPGGSIARPFTWHTKAHTLLPARPAVIMIEG